MLELNFNYERDKIMKTTIFRNEEKISTQEAVSVFNTALKEIDLFEGTEIEQLADAYAKNPVDKFIISEKPNVPVAQGDILIWAEGTKDYKENIKSVQKLEVTERLVLQEGDSMTGDHRLVPLEGSNFTLQKGQFSPSVLKGKNSWGDRPYNCLLLDIDKPFLIVHREHGNVALPSGKYMICSSMNSETLERMMD